MYAMLFNRFPWSGNRYMRKQSHEIEEQSIHRTFAFENHQQPNPRPFLREMSVDSTEMVVAVLSPGASSDQDIVLEEPYLLMFKRQLHAGYPPGVQEP